MEKTQMTDVEQAIIILDIIASMWANVHHPYEYGYHSKARAGQSARITWDTAYNATTSAVGIQIGAPRQVIDIAYYAWIQARGIDQSEAAYSEAACQLRDRLNA